jgi:hypothetical protein
MLDWTAIGTIVAILALLISTWRQIAESKRYRIAQSVELLLKLEDRFDNDEFRKIRKRAAKKLLKGDLYSAGKILDFFETIGLLLERGVLDKDMVWSSFDYWIRAYTQAADAHIKRVQNQDPTTWTYVCSLRKSMDEVQMKFGKTQFPPLTTKEIKEFLLDESVD